MCSAPVGTTGIPRGMSWQRTGNAAGESTARAPGEAPPPRGWAHRPPAGYVTIGSVRYGVRFASTVGESAAPSRPCAPPGSDGGHRDVDCCCGVQLSWPRSPSRLPLPAADKQTIIRRGIFSRLNAGDVPLRPVSGGSVPQPPVYKSTLEWCAKKPPTKSGVRSCFRGADDDDGGLKMTRESPPAAPSLRPRVIVRSKPQLPAYLQGKPDTESLITSPHHTLERLNRFRFGGGSGAERKEAQRPKKKRSSSDKTERLRELTERLKSPSASAAPAGVDRGSRDASPAASGGGGAPAGRLPTCASADHNKCPATTQKQPRVYNLKEPENQRISAKTDGTPTEPRSLQRFGRTPARSSPPRDKHQQTSTQQDLEQKQREDLQEQRKRLTKQATITGPTCSSPDMSLEPSVPVDAPPVVGSVATEDSDDDPFLLHRPESRTIVGSYTQTKIPYRSASFSQVDYSSVDGKYVRNPGRTSPYGGYGGSHTLPRKKLTPLETIGSVDSSAGSEEGFVASVASLAGEFAADASHRAGTRSLTHPLPSPRGRISDDIAFSSVDGNGMKGLLAASRELQEVVEESETSSDNGTVTFCMGADDEPLSTVAAKTEDAVTDVSEGREEGEAPTEVPSVEGDRTEVGGDVLSDVVPLIADVLSEDRTETVETLSSPWLFALERNRSIVPNQSKDGKYESAEIEKHKQYPVITIPTVVFQADITSPEVMCDSVVPEGALRETTLADDEGEVVVGQWNRVGAGEAARGAGGRVRHDEEIDYSKECVRQCEEWLKELGEDFKTQNKPLCDEVEPSGVVAPPAEDVDVHVHVAEDVSREEVHVEPPGAECEVMEVSGAPDGPKVEIARSAPLTIERVEPEKFNENLKKLPQNANEVAIITTPPQWTDDVSKRWSGGDGTGTDDWGSPSEEPQTPEDAGGRPQWPTPLGNRRWPLVYQSSDERDDDAMPRSRPSPRRYLQVRTDSLSEGESEHGEGRPRTPTREDRDLTASPLLTQSEEADVRGVKEPRRHEPRRYSKRPLRGPYGQMLEAEMKKPETNRKAKLNYNEDLKVFLEEYRPASPPTPTSPDLLSPTPRRALASHSMDDSQLKGGYGRSASVSSPPSATRTSPKRKVSANLPFPCVEPAESGGLMARHQRTTSSPSTLDGYSGGPGRDTSLRPEPTPELLAELLRGSSELLSTSSSTINGNSLQDMRDTRTHVVVELYDTERNYVEALQILVMKYLQPLKSPENAGLVDAALVDEIFYQVPAILQHHELLLDELRKRLDNWDINQKIGDVFLDAFTRQPVIETYTAFINNWKSAKEAIKTTCQAKPAFARFIEAMAREHKGKLALDCLLIKPVQRIPRYELLIQRLLKHTDPSHPDHALLLEAQKEVHELAVKINCTERESLEYEQQQQTLKELENIIEGSINLVSSERTFVRHDTVTMASGQGTRKERALFLFSDLLVITSIKRRSGAIRKPPNTCPGSLASTLEANKYKLLMRIPLDDLDVVKSKDENLKKRLREMENLTEDILTLSQIGELTAALHCPHSQLEDLVKEMMSTAGKQLEEQRTTDAQLSYLELTLNTHWKKPQLSSDNIKENNTSGMENISVVFTKAEKRSWEDSFNEAKQKLALSADRRPSPEFVSSVPIRKTRAGLQFTCAAATLGLNAANLRDVWVCNSDGYVGQVCVLSLHPEPNVISCNGVCNARILCVASIPAGITGPTSLCTAGTLPFTHNKIGISISVEDADKSGGNIQLDSSSSSSDDDDDTDDRTHGIALPDDDVKRARSASDSHLPDRDSVSGQDRSGQSDPDTDSLQPTMWLGTEDGCIHVYNCSDNIRIKKNKVKIQHGSSVHCIIYLDNRVFVSLANGDITVYIRDQSGWNTTDPYTVSVGTAATPVTRMLPVAGKLWCGCHNAIKILNTFSLEVEHSFVVNADPTRSVTWLATAGLGAWVSLHNSAIVRLFHATTFECLTEVNVAPAVNKMLASCDDIIRQHKAACLRVTSLLACKDLLWIGTSAGVILTMPLPHISPTTTKLATPPSASGVPHGHTGHVRFLTFVEAAPSPSPDGLAGRPNVHHRYSLKTKPDINQSNAKLLVISGGDGYEDFRTSSASEVAGREDSTNHLLIWHV